MRRPSAAARRFDQELASMVGCNEHLVIRILGLGFQSGLHGRGGDVGAVLLTNKMWNWVMSLLLKTVLMRPDSHYLYEDYSQEPRSIRKMQFRMEYEQGIIRGIEFPENPAFQVDTGAVALKDVRYVHVRIPQQHIVDPVLDEEVMDGYEVALLQEHHTIKTLRKLQCMLSQLPCVTELRIFEANFRLQRGLQILAATLASIPRLSKLAVVNVVQRDGHDVLLSALGHLHDLEHLRLRGSSLNASQLCAFGTAARSFSRTLKNLQLENAGMGDEEAHELVGIVHGLEKLESFSVADNRIGPKGAGELVHALQRVPQLRHLALDANLLGERDVHFWADGLTALASVDTLSLRRNKLGVDAARVLASRLQGLKHLKGLDLSDNALGDEGVRALVRGWQTPVSLRCISLGGMGLTPLAHEAVRKWPHTVEVHWLGDVIRG